MAHKLKYKNKKFTSNLSNKNGAKSFTAPRLFNNYQFKSVITTDTDDQEYEINDLYSREDETSNDASGDSDVVEVEVTENVSLSGSEEPFYSPDDNYTEILQIQNECAICKMVFNTQHELVRHAHVVHPNARAFKCRKCKTVFSKIESVPQHFKAVHGSTPRPETCDYCNRSFFTKSQLEKHKKSHSEERPFSCDQCNKNYKYQRNLLVHKKTHKKNKSPTTRTSNSDNEFTKDEEEDLAVSYNLEGDETLEETSTINEADINNSGYTYFIIDELNTDIEENNELNDDDVIFEGEVNEADKEVDDSHLNSESHREVDINECAVCFQMFSCQQAVYKHVRQEHPDTEIFKCPYCDDNFYSHELLEKHVKIHRHLQKKNVCPQCFKSFDRGNDLRRHQLTHSDARPFLCEICNKGFKQVNHLKRHLEKLHKKRSQEDDINSNNKRFKCGFCSMSYDSNASLHRHFLSHSTVRNFTCSICNRSFKERSHLKGHEKIHYT